jgi:hypothetical protein
MAGLDPATQRARPRAKNLHEMAGSRSASLRCPAMTFYKEGYFL